MNLDEEGRLHQGIKDEISSHIRSRQMLGKKIKELKEQVRIKTEALEAALDIPSLMEDKFYEREPVTPSRDFYKEGRLKEAKKHIPKIIKQIKAAIDA